MQRPAHRSIASPVAPRRLALTLVLALAAGAAASLPGPADAKNTMVVLDLRLRGQDEAATRDAADRLGKMVASSADRELVATPAALGRLRRSIVVPPQHETTKRLEEIYADIKRGDELLYTNPGEAIPVLDKAKRELETILAKLAVDGTVQEKLFQTQMLLARSHMDNGDRGAAKTVLAEIIREYGIREDVNQDNYHPDLVALYEQTAGELETKRTGALRVESADGAALQILVNRRPVERPDGTPATTPYVVENLLPGAYHVQVRRSEGDVSKIHRVVVPEAGEAAKTIDLEFDQALTLDPASIGLLFADVETLEAQLPEYAARLGQLVEVDEVLTVGVLQRAGAPELFAVRFTVARRKPIETVQIPVATAGPEERQLFKATQVLCGFEDAPRPAGPRIVVRGAEEGGPQPWYTDWVGWTLVGVGVVSVGVGGYFTGDYIDKRDCATDLNCKTFDERVGIADDAITSRNISYAMYGIGGASIVAGVLVFVLRDRGPADTAFDPAHAELPLVAPLTLPDGGGFVLQGRF